MKMVSGNADADVGRKALMSFHNYAISKYKQNYNRSFEQLLDELASNRVIGGPYLTEGLGLAINSNEMSDSKVRAAMEFLADKGQGRLPATSTAWFKALTDQSTSVSFLESIPYVAVESAKDVVKGTAEIGKAVIDTGKSLLTVGPILIVGAVIFIGYAYTRRIAGR